MLSLEKWAAISSLRAHGPTASLSILFLLANRFSVQLLAKRRRSLPFWSSLRRHRVALPRSGSQSKKCPRPSRLHRIPHSSSHKPRLLGIPMLWYEEFPHHRGSELLSYMTALHRYFPPRFHFRESDGGPPFFSFFFFATVSPFPGPAGCSGVASSGASAAPTEPKGGLIYVAAHALKRSGPQQGKRPEILGQARHVYGRNGDFSQPAGLALAEVLRYLQLPLPLLPPKDTPSRPSNS